MGQRGKLQVLATEVTSPRSPATPFLMWGFQKITLSLLHTLRAEELRAELLLQELLQTFLRSAAMHPACHCSCLSLCLCKSLSHVETREEGNPWEIAAPGGKPGAPS